MQVPEEDVCEVRDRFGMAPLFEGLLVLLLYVTVVVICVKNYSVDQGWP